MEKFNPYKIGVIGGAGYVGLVTSVGLASLGHNVLSQDLNNNRINLPRRRRARRAAQRGTATRISS